MAHGVTDPLVSHEIPVGGRHRRVLIARLFLHPRSKVIVHRRDDRFARSCSCRLQSVLIRLFGLIRFQGGHLCVQCAKLVQQFGPALGRERLG